MQHIPPIFLDVDGVFADYEGQYRRLSGGDPHEKGKIKAGRFRNMPHFYLNLPLLPGAMQLWNYVKVYNPKFLTASSNFQSTSKSDKLAWVKHHFGVHDDRIIVVAYPTDKWKYATPGAILIDDMQKNCDAWKQAGGHAILYHTAEDAIRQLKAALGHGPATHVVETFEQLAERPLHVEEAFANLPLQTPNIVECFDLIAEEE